jgi:hypothetical protein
MNAMNGGRAHLAASTGLNQILSDFFEKPFGSRGGRLLFQSIAGSVTGGRNFHFLS